MNEQTSTGESPRREEIGHIVEMVSAYVSNNQVTLNQVGEVIKTFATEFDALKRGPQAETVAVAERAAPAVSIKKSVTPDYLISLFDGRKLKSLKRYLSTKHGMTPDEYRAHWGLPRDYPMVAPNYAQARSELAKKMGLGQGGRRRQSAAASTAKGAAKTTPQKGAGRGRRKANASA